MHSAVLLTIFVVLVQSSQMKDIDDHWEDFKKSFERNYEPEEEAKRKNIFRENFFKIQEHNEEAAKGLHSYTLKITPFADMTNEEFRESRMSSFKLQDAFPETKMHVPLEKPPAADSYFDWQDLGCTSSVQNQGNCGSCWAFAAAGALECRYFKNFGGSQLIPLSPQCILDCASPCGNIPNSCIRGSSYCVFEQFKSAQKAVNSLADYPYERAKRYCRFDSNKFHVWGGGGVRVSRDENSIIDALVRTGPICITIDSSPYNFQHYGGGIFDDTSCSDTYYDHVVLIVGYAPDYFRIKNSWGTGWGEDGYIRIRRGRNRCGVNNWPNYPSF